MPVELPKGLPFSVDTWNPSSKIKRHHFLTHAHRDHSVGILAHSSYPIYSTLFTKTLLLQQFPQLDESLFVGIEVGQSVICEDPDGDFCVLAFDANHCPGAVMFLFEGKFGNILHTGDCRLTPECLLALPDKYICKKGREPKCKLDFVFLDCTFGNVPLDMPSKHYAIRQVINCIWKHPDAPVVYLTCNMLGQEDVLLNISQTFGSKIYVDKDNAFFYALNLTIPEIISQDPSSRFQLFDGFPNLNERASAEIKEAQANSQPEPLIIRPSTQWYAHNEIFSGSGNRKIPRINEAVKDPFGIWHVCYSMHSSRVELEWALKLLSPKWVVSTTPNCRALELGYVKKHCSGAQISPDDPLWKLLDISVETSSLSVETSITKEVCYLEIDETVIETSNKVLVQQLTISSPPSKKPTPITLFGRARHGLQFTTSSALQENSSHLTTQREDIVERKCDNFIEDAGLGLQVTTSPALQEKAKVSCTNSSHLTTEKDDIVEMKCDYSTSPTLQEKVKVTCKYSSYLTKQKEHIVEVKCDNFVEAKVLGCYIGRGGENLVVKVNDTCESVHSPIGSSKSYSEAMRKLYRTMNVPVPRPLPSLVELLNNTKRAKRSF